MARCFAVTMSQEPGLSGMPEIGHSLSATTSASCASSSAMPTSRTIRVSPAMIRACSILKIASMVARARRWASAAVMATDQAIVSAQVQARGSAPARTASSRLAVVRRPVHHLPKLDFALPALPVLLVKVHEAGGPRERFLLRFHIEDGVAADHLLGLSERPIDHGHLAAAGEHHPRAGCARHQPAHIDHRSVLGGFFPELADGFDELLWRWAGTQFFGRLDQGHEPHCRVSFC